MTLQVLVAAMHQTDHSLLEKMNIQSDAMVGNQCDRNEIESFEWNGHQISYYSLAERGVGLNRNTLLMRASADIILFADSDVTYMEGYEKIILSAYERFADADLILFNLRESRGDEPFHDIVTSTGRAGRGIVSKFGAVSISAKTESIRRAGISFSLLFGGGARYSCGEDTIFLQDCLKKGLRVYTCTDTIGTVKNEDSTWFNGYHEKYFVDKGGLFAYMYPRLGRCLAIYHILKHRKEYSSFGVMPAMKCALRGVAEQRNKKTASAGGKWTGDTK